MLPKRGWQFGRSHRPSRVVAFRSHPRFSREDVMETLTQDLRYALRTLARTPGFVAVTLLTLALGIGANLAIFTVVDAVLLRPLPFKEPQRVVRIFDDLPGAGARDVGMSVPEMQDV